MFLRFKDEPSFSFFGSNYAVLLLFINVTWLFVSGSQRVYQVQSFINKNRYAFSVAIAIVFQLLITVAFNGLIKTFYSRVFLFYTYINFTILLIIGRKITYFLYNNYLKSSLKQNAVVIFEDKNALNDLKDCILNNISADNQKTVYFHDKDKLIDELEALKTNYFVSEIYLPISSFNEDEIEQVAVYCDNNFARLRLIFDWKKLSSRNLIATRHNQTTIIKVALTPLDDPYNALIKRLFDLVLSLLLFIFIFSWLFPIIAIAVKLSSKGPIFFVQRRSGLNNEGFNCLKFRSMRPNTEANKKQATKDDPRITRIGAFLRQTSLDEIPQFINVLRGEMSVVGPRPHMLKHTEEYRELVGNFMNRHAIKPGITGLAQIKGYRGEIDDFSLLQNRLRLDRFYVNNWTLFFDLKIVFYTIAVIFKSHR
tara:strand:- start:3098 stop:4369 length:1272 start_codon:yes stop_codon:yes gene_type:complete